MAVGIQKRQFWSAKIGWLGQETLLGRYRAGSSRRGRVMNDGYS